MSRAPLVHDPSRPRSDRQAGHPQRDERDLLPPDAPAEPPSRADPIQQGDVEDHQPGRQRGWFRLEQQGDREQEPGHHHPATRPGALAWMSPDVGQDRAHREPDRGQVRLTRGPGHDLDPQRMDREQQGGQTRAQGSGTTAPSVHRQPPAIEQDHDQAVEQRGIRGVQDEADRVIPAGGQAPKGRLGFEEDPGERLVDPGPVGDPGPADPVPRQTAEIEVPGEIVLVVPADEPVSEDRQERQDRNDRQGQGCSPASEGSTIGRRAFPARFNGLRHDSDSSGNPVALPTVDGR